MSGDIGKAKKNPLRVRSTSNKKWQRSEERALITYFKQNRDFEKPSARIYYTKFLFESGIDVDWKLVRSKVRNMRTVYLKAKEREYKGETDSGNIEDMRNQILNICWYVDDFDILFPNLVNDHINKFSYPNFDDEFSKPESFFNAGNSSKHFLPEEDSTVSSLSKSIDGDVTTVQKSMFSVKTEKLDEDENGKQPEPKQINNILNWDKETLRLGIQLKGREIEQTPFRNRCNPVRKWQRNEEVALIAFLKENRDFERPNSRIYYTNFLLESKINSDWSLVRSKVRNMRTSYRKAKEHEIKETDSGNCNSQLLRSQVLKICWFVDDFDIIFPNEMNKSACLQAYKRPDSISEDEFFRDESNNNDDNTSKNIEDNTSKNIEDNTSQNFDKNFLLEEESTASSLSNSTDGDIVSVQKNLFELKKRKRYQDTNFKKQELELAKEKLNFEKEKFRQEIRLKEKEIESEEKLKIMEFQMKERIAIRKLEIDEMLALRSIEKPMNSYSDVYNHFT